MIKGGLGYLKYLKLFGTLFLISCFTGLFANSVSAYTNDDVSKVGSIGLTSYTSPMNSAIENSFLSRGTIFSSILGQSFQTFALNDYIYAFWTRDGRLYFKAPRFEGYFNGYYVCDMIVDGRPTNCGYVENGDDYKTILSNFFKKVNNDDSFYYRYIDSDVCGGGGCSDSKRIDLCWDSEEVGKSVCFGYYRCSNNYACNQYNYGDLVNSMSLSYKYSSLPRDLIGVAPGTSTYLSSIDGGSQTIDGQYQYTGDVVVNSCTKQKALTWYGCQGYSDRMCFSSYENNTDIFDGNPVGAFAIPGKDIASVYSDTRYLRRGGATGDSFDYGEWFGYWRNTYNVYKHSDGAINNPFIGVPVGLFTLMGNVDNYGLPYNNSSIVEFCTLALYTQDLSADYDGVVSNVVCNLTPIELVDCSFANEIGGGGVGGVGSTGTIGPVGSSWDGITNRSGYHDKPGGNVIASLQNYQDGKSFENSFFNLLKENFKYPTGGGGSPLLPTYIIIAMCGLILFRFLSH